MKMRLGKFNRFIVQFTRQSVVNERPFAAFDYKGLVTEINVEDISLHSLSPEFLRTLLQGESEEEMQCWELWWSWKSFWLQKEIDSQRLVPSHNGILTICHIQSMTQMTLKLSEFIPLDHVIELIKPYRVSKTWQIQVAASRALIELEFQCKGIDAALKLFIKYLNDETSLRGQTKLGVCALRLSQVTSGSDQGKCCILWITLRWTMQLLQS